MERLQFVTLYVQFKFSAEVRPLLVSVVFVFGYVTLKKARVRVRLTRVFTHPAPWSSLRVREKVLGRVGVRPQSEVVDRVFAPAPVPEERVFCDPAVVFFVTALPANEEQLPLCLAVDCQDFLDSPEL